MLAFAFTDRVSEPIAEPVTDCLANSNAELVCNGFSIRNVYAIANYKRDPHAQFVELFVTDTNSEWNRHSVGICNQLAVVERFFIAHAVDYRDGIRESECVWDA